MNNVQREFEDLYIDVYGDESTIVEIKPNSTTDSYIGDMQLVDPFYVRVKDKEFNEDIHLSLSIKQAEQIRDLLDDKIKLIKENLNNV